MIFSAIAELGSTIIQSITGHFKRKQEIKTAVIENKARMARNEQSHNHDWELKQLENAGWKDDILFYAIISMYVYSIFDPQGAKEIFEIWSTVIPDWFLTITGWLVASVLGVKKIGDYLPGAIAGIREALKK